MEGQKYPSYLTGLSLFLRTILVSPVLDCTIPPRHVRKQDNPKLRITSKTAMFRSEGHGTKEGTQRTRKKEGEKGENTLVVRIEIPNGKNRDMHKNDMCRKPESRKEIVGLYRGHHGVKYQTGLGANPLYMERQNYKEMA